MFAKTSVTSAHAVLTQTTRKAVRLPYAPPCKLCAAVSVQCSTMPAPTWMIPPRAAVQPLPGAVAARPLEPEVPQLEVSRLEATRAVLAELRLVVHLPVAAAEVELHGSPRGLGAGVGTFPMNVW